MDVVTPGEEEDVTLMPIILLRLSKALRLASVVLAGSPEMGALPISLDILPSRITVQKEKLLAESSFLDRCCCSSPVSGE